MDCPVSKKFAVVEFTAEGSVALIPAIWLLENNKKCYWPSKAVGSQLNSVVKKCATPAEDWTVYDVAVIYSTGEFQIICRISFS